MRFCLQYTFCHFYQELKKIGEIHTLLASPDQNQTLPA